MTQFRQIHSLYKNFKKMGVKATMKRKSWVLLLAVIIVLSIFAAACGKSTSNGGESGGTLIFGRGDDSTRLDPITVTDGESFRVTKNIFDTLLDYEDDNMKVVPALAESWQISEDGLTYTFQLRQGVKFHDGTPFNAEAVKFNFDRWADPNDPQKDTFEYYTSQFGDVIKEVEVKDEYTVVFHLNRTQGPFLQNLAMPPFGIASPTALKEKGEKFAQEPVGTGPFIFKEWKAKDTITLEKNPDYWMKGYPKLDRVIFKVIPDNSARLNALKAGDIDIMDNVNPADVEKVKADDNLTLMIRPAFNVAYLGFNTEKEPLNKPEVRRAIAHAVNKQGIIDALYSGMATPAKNPMPPSLWGYNDEIQDYEYDLDKAKQLLAEAGYPNGFKVNFYAMTAVRAYMPDGPKVAEIIAADLKKIGIETEIVSPEWTVYLDETREGKQDLFLLGWIGDNGDPDNFIYALLDQDNINGNNRARYANPELHEILIQAQSLTDQAEREELYKRAQEIIHEDQPWVPLAHADSGLVSSKKVKGFVPHPGGADKLTKTYIED